MRISSSSKWVRNLWLVFSYLILLVAMAAVLVPILYIFFASFNTGSSLYSSTMIPKNFTMQNYRLLFNNPNKSVNFSLWTVNTLKIASATSIASVVLTSFTAYAFSRFRFWGRRYGLIMFLVVQMFPGAMGMVAIYVLLNILGLLDTHVGLILIYTGGAIPFSTWMAKGYIDSIPRSLDEAALIDGASRWQIYWRILMPLSLPILSVIALLNFIGPFNDYLLARIVLTSPEKRTLAVGLHAFISGQFDQNWTQFAAGSMLTAIPIMILFLSLQKYFISGLTAGATKG